MIRNTSLGTCVQSLYLL